MGIGQTDLSVLLRLRQKGYLADHGKVAEIGAQQLNNSFFQATSELRELGTLYGKSTGYVPPKPRRSLTLHGGVEHLEEDAPLARPFWEWLGYSYMAIDIDGSPNSIPLDLNYDDVPPDAVKQCQLVTNYGTTEHVANQLQAFKIIHDLTAIGGVMLHHLPAQGMFNHGFINYNPKFFWMLSRSNNYKFVFMNFSYIPDRFSLPDNVMQFIEESDVSSAERAKNYQCSDASLIVAMQKVHDIDFVPPIDVQTGSTTNDAKLRRRYWTVFDKTQVVDNPRRIIERINALRVLAAARK